MKRLEMKLALSSPQLFRLMFWVHWRAFVATFHNAVRKSPLLLVVLAGLMSAYVAVGYWLFHAGLNYLVHFPVVGSLLSQRILYLVFGFFFLMLVFSNAVVGYSALFRSRETTWFLSLPIPHHGVYRWKFLEALAVSSWALIFLSAPLLLAFGQVKRVRPIFYLEEAALLLPFVVLAALLGSWLILFLVRFLARPWAKWALGAGAVVILATITLRAKPAGESETASAQETVTFDQLLRHTRLSTNGYLPSAWLTRSTLFWSDGLTRQGSFFFLLLASNAAMGLVVGFELVGRCFHGSWSVAFSSRAARLQRRSEALRLTIQRRSWLERAVGLLSPISGPGAALTLKDIRLFWRDPTQWIQFLIFFGLLCIYVLNLRNMAHTFQNPFWEVMIAHFNLAACGLTLSTLTTRFVFPQFSLEGRRIWILGLSPLGLPRLLAQKFFFAAAVSIGITGPMIVISSLLLHLSWLHIAGYALAICGMSAALCGLSVGLGALFPSFKEENPSKIVSGFGGTLCLVVSFIYLVLFLTLTAIPGLRSVGWDFFLPDALALGLAAALTLALLVLPLQLARTRVKSLEI